MSTMPLRIVKANACSHFDPSEVSRLAVIWEEYTMLTCLPFQQRNIREWLEEGFEPCVIEMAMEQTAVAPRPAWRYLQSIMAYSRADGALTGDAFIRRPKRHQRPSLPL